MRRSSIAAAAVFVLLGAAAAVATVASRSHPTGGLASVAEAAWRAQNEYFVTGFTETEPAYAAWFDAQRADLDIRRAAVTDIGYFRQTTKLVEVHDTFARRDRARITVTIDSTLDMRGPPGAPEYTGSNEEIEFHFRWERGAWWLHHVRPLGKP